MFSFRKIWKYIWPHIRNHQTSFYLTLFGYGLGVFFDNIVKPYLFKNMIDTIVTGGNHQTILHRIIIIGVMFCVAVIFQNVGYRLGDYASVFFQSTIMKELNDSTLHRLLNHSYKFFTSNFSGSIIAKARRFARSFETIHDIFSYQIWFTFIQLVCIIGILFYQIPTLGWIFLGWATVYLGTIALFVRRKIKLDMREAEADSKVTASLADIITNIINIKIFARNRDEQKSFEKVTSDEEHKRSLAWNFSNLENIALAIIAMALHVISIIFFIYLWNKNQITVGTILMIETYIQSLLSILWTLGKSLTRGVKALVDMQEIVDIFEQEPDIVDAKNPRPFMVTKGNIVFEKVSFRYHEKSEVFSDFNLDIKPGERIGLVGHSGAGKSTITKLLLRFAEVTGGNISIDGQDIKMITQDDLRKVISYVPQEPVLFHRTIRENIIYAKPNATTEEIVEVAKKAHAHEFISKLPKGYDTLVGERGVKLSGGERQRVVIARAMLKDAPILVLDEATSSLDSVSESYIQEAFAELMKEKTTIVIAHRLSTIQKMDRIIVLDNGTIAEEGTHKELLKKKGIYAELWEHQSGGFIN